MKTFVSTTFVPPTTIKLADGYALRPLGPDDVEADCAAVNANIDLIRRTRGGNWPQEYIAVDEDLGDLKEHERQFHDREAFAYVVSRVSDGEYLGCIYIYPPHHPFDDTDHSNMPTDADASVSFWVTGDAYNAGIYNEICRILPGWLVANWPFEHPYITNIEK